MKYKVNDLVIMRSPLNNLSHFSAFDEISKNRDGIKDFLKSNLEFKEAIAGSNFSLFKMIENEKVGSKQQETINKYFIRSIIRCSPFGLLSGIACCRFNNQTNIRRKSARNLSKHCTVDFEWFYGVVRLLEKNKNILHNIKVKFNDQCYKCGDRLINPYTSNYGQVYVNNTSEEVIKSRIKYSKQIDFIINAANEWIPYKELIEKLYAYNENVEVDTIERYINQLIDNEYLITDLRVPLSNIDPLQQVLTKLEKINLEEEERALYNKLNNINNLRKKYIHHELGYGIDDYSYLCNKMSEIYKVKNYLSILSKIEMDLNYLGNNIKKEINSFLKFITVFSTEDNETPYIYEFKKKYVEIYGEYREIPILDLLDDTIGIGNPYGEISEVNIESSKRKIIKKYISDKIILALKNGEEEIKLTEKDISFFEKIEKNNLNYSNSFELNVKIFAEDNQAINNNKFKILLAPCCGSNKTGKLVNRFYNILDVESQTKLNQIYRSVEKNEDFITADTSYLPKGARINNICNGNSNYNYSLDCGLEAVDEDRSIDLSDIVVGYNSNIDRLYIKSMKHNRIINAVSDNMLNRMVDNNLIRFMWDISYAYEIHPLEQILTLINYDFKYIPAISYGKVTIIPETWKIDNSDFSKLDSFAEFEKEFETYKSKWGIPRYIYFLVHDRYMYVDTKDSICIKYFYQEVWKLINRNQEIIIQEAENFNQLWVLDDNGNNYYSEFVLQCLNVSNNKSEVNPVNDLRKCEFTKSNVKNNLNNLLVIDKDRNYLPLDNNWLYFKIYLEPSKLVDFILQEIGPFIKELFKNDMISNFFFIRYRDPDLHLRFRVKIREKTKKYDTFGLIISWLKTNYGNKFLKKFTIDTYSRETERYGGNDSIRYAEDIFKWDSFIVIKILELSDSNPGFDLNLISFICIFSFIKNSFSDTNTAEVFLDNYVGREYRKEFRKEKDKYVNAIKKYDMLIEDYDLLTIFKNRERSIVSGQ